MVSYDDLVPPGAQAEMATTAAHEGAWREARRDILAAVRAAATEDGKCPPEEEGEGKGAAAEHYKKIVKNLDGDGGEKRTLFVVDDNNYYRSMRQEYHRLARDAGAGFCQLHVSMTAEQAFR